jgi:hypothetical protein
MTGLGGGLFDRNSRQAGKREQERAMQGALDAVEIMTFLFGSHDHLAQRARVLAAEGDLQGDIGREMQAILRVHPRPRNNLHERQMQISRKTDGDNEERRKSTLKSGAQGFKLRPRVPAVKPPPVDISSG